MGTLAATSAGAGDRFEISTLKEVREPGRRMGSRLRETPGRTDEGATGAMVVEEEARAFVDVGKVFHRAHVLDAPTTKPLSRRAENGEADPAALIDEVLALSYAIVWATGRRGLAPWRTDGRRTV